MFQVNVTLHVLFVFIFQLLSAIQSIDEVLNPSLRASSSRGSGESHRGMPRRWGDLTPWRREGKASAEKQTTTRLPETEGMLNIELLKATACY